MTSKYTVTARTGRRSGAGTDAEISISFIGELGESGPHVLDRSLHNDFEKGAVDAYEVPGDEVGELYAVRVKNHTLLVKDDWLLEEVTVESGGRLWRFPFHRWVRADRDVLVLEGTARLPQHVRTPREAAVRGENLAYRREVYRWSEGDGTLPGSLDVTEERPIPVDEVYRDLSDQNYTVTYVETLGELKVSQALVGLAWNALDKCEAMLEFVGLPGVAKRWKDDVEFGRQTLQGVDPTNIRLATAMPGGMPFGETEAYGLLDAGTTLSSAIAQKRVFLLDFPELARIPMYESGEGEDVVRRYAPPARALFYLDAAKKLRPIAIQLGQDKSAPVWTPKDTENDWMAAKMFLRCAEGNVHQIVSHAVRTHFAMEPFIVAAMRNLPASHPVYKLMRRHFLYTLAINQGARGALLGPGGIFDEFIACGGPAQGHFQLAKAAWKGWSFPSARLPDDLAARGVLDPAVLPEYPYRDDALPIWNAIGDYVKETLELFYATDADVVRDTELQAFWADILENGIPREKLPYGKLTTRDQVIDVLHTVIFTVSVVHTGVNNLQFEHYAFILNAPLAMHAPPPVERGKITRDDLARMLPSLAQAQGQAAVGKALSTLGKDEEYLLPPDGWARAYFLEAGALAARERFFQKLRDHVARIDAANRDRDVAYGILRPDRVPCSITI